MNSRGKVLYEPRSDTDMAGMTSTQLEYQMNMQRQLEQRVEQLLTPIVGPGRAIVRVNADLDFDRTTIRKETFDPKSAVVRSEVKNEEENRGAANVGGSIQSTKDFWADADNDNGARRGGPTGCL